MGSCGYPVMKDISKGTSQQYMYTGCRGGGLKSATFCVLRTKKYDIPRHSKDVSMHGIIFECSCYTFGRKNGR
ncbi:ORF1311 [White spot syndrome virus]|uniref:ORF1311 n=1 Tax=White spot syndrome virus TaxID=342409 RepID=A0A2D3I6H5_9VIRU|nr:ORF1311 [White spot syndrome virus]